MSSAPAISILVISYNTREMTLACLRSVVEQTTPGTFEVIVVDNQSKDGSARVIDAEVSANLRIGVTERLGFAEASDVDEPRMWRTGGVGTASGVAP